MVRGILNIKAILFDCDGTLVDSEYAHYLGWKKALNHFGSDLSLEDYYQYVGISAETNSQLFSKLIGIDSADLILKMKRDHYRDLDINSFAPFADTVAFLKLLASKKESLGLKIGVCSAAKKADVLAHLKCLEIDHLLDIVLSGQDDLHEYSDPEGVNKPKPYIYMHAVKLLGVAPQESIVIEDSAIGAWAGVNAGCFTIAIPNDYTKHHDFNHTHWQLDSFSGMDVNTFLKKIKSLKNS